VVAGDLNASTQFPEPYRTPYRIVHQRIEGLGLVNVTTRALGVELDGCPCEDQPCRHIRTLEGATPYQDDYIYASPDVAAAARPVEILRTTHIEAVSDHYPLAIDLPD
jgi:endonuclease/exonuclease/phosphatase family metal-dependent hydrolase